MALNNPPAPATSRVDPETIQKAITALLKWNKSKSKTQKPQLLDQDQEDQFIYLILTLKKIPPKGRTNPHKIPLPHPLHSPHSSELCLIIDDRPNKSLLTSEAAKTKIKSEDIPISKLLKLSKLKTNYRPFEAKRKLCDSYHVFFADKRVVPLLPKLLGKQFYKKKKIPIPIDVSHKNWKEQIERACGSAMLYLRTGTCSVVRVGRGSMERDEIVDNVVAAINGVAEIVPRKWANVRSFHLKFSESLALPVYQALPDMRLKIEGVKKSNEEGGEGSRELEVKEEGAEKLGKRKGSKKGRIHEVRYMDSNVDEDELGSDGDEDDGESERKIENEEMGSAEFGGKKRKKGDSAKERVLGMLDVEKRAKKLAKVKKEDGVKQKKDGLSLKGGEEAEGRKEKKKSGLGKLKNGEMKVKDKKSKKIRVVE